jgi:hypothetical protein
VLRIPFNKWFSLPRLGRDAFSELMKARVKYETRLGFKISSDTDLNRALSVLSNALDQKVELEWFCFICDKPLSENESSERTICSECRNREDAYAIYTMKFANLFEKL